MNAPIYEVHEGFWIDWSNGRVTGATLTLTEQHGAYLIAFLALFVHISGSSLWRLTSFIVFRIRAGLGCCEKVTFQQQAILRNGSSAIAALSALVLAAVRSKKRQKHIALICWALANCIGVLAAGILSSKVASKQPDVLLQPTNCGRWWKFEPGGATHNIVIDEEWFREVSLNFEATQNLYKTSSQLASVCYTNANPNSGCFWFARQPLQWTSAIAAGCAFDDESICQANTSFSIDSGFVDSDRHLGINSMPEDRIKIRIQKSCSPLKKDGYFQIYDSSNVSEIVELGVPWEQQFVEGAGLHPQLGAFLYGGNGFWKNNATFVHNNDTQIETLGILPPEYSLKYMCPSR